MVKLNYVKPTTFRAAKGSLERALSITPQAKTVLAHLLRHGDITPLKADAVYGISRLAACIFEIRNAGFNIYTDMHRDDCGRKYAQYVYAG
jgi:hypothetical protein